MEAKMNNVPPLTIFPPWQHMKQGEVSRKLHAFQEATICRWKDWLLKMRLVGTRRDGCGQEGMGWGQVPFRTGRVWGRVGLVEDEDVWLRTRRFRWGIEDSVEDEEVRLRMRRFCWGRGGFVSRVNCAMTKMGWLAAGVAHRVFGHFPLPSVYSLHTPPANGKQGWITWRYILNPADQ